MRPFHAFTRVERFFSALRTDITFFFFLFFLFSLCKMKQKMKNMKIMVLLDVSVYNIYISRPCNISEDMPKSLRIFLIVILTPKHPYSEYKIIYQKEKKNNENGRQF